MYKVLCHQRGKNNYAVFVIGVVVYTKFYPVAFGIASNERTANLQVVLELLREALPREAVADGHLSFRRATASVDMALYLCHVHALRTATSQSPSERAALTHLVCDSPTAAAWEAGAALLRPRAAKGVAALERWGRAARPCSSIAGRATHTNAAEGWNRGWKAARGYLLNTYRMLQEVLLGYARAHPADLLTSYPKPNAAELAHTKALARRLIVGDNAHGVADVARARARPDPRR
jgi:hypothetical protein